MKTEFAIKEDEIYEVFISSWNIYYVYGSNLLIKDGFVQLGNPLWRDTDWCDKDGSESSPTEVGPIRCPIYRQCKSDAIIKDNITISLVKDKKKLDSLLVRYEDMQEYREVLKSRFKSIPFLDRLPLYFWDFRTIDFMPEILEIALKNKESRLEEFKGKSPICPLLS